MKTKSVVNRKQSVDRRAKVGITKILFPLWIALMVVISGNAFSQGYPEKLVSMEGKWLMNAQWSPDGKHIAFTADNYNGLWIMEADGKNLRNLSSDLGVGFGYSWSHDGNYILARFAELQDRRREHGVKIYNISNKAEHTLYEKSSGFFGVPQWLPDGAGVLLADHREPRKVNTNLIPPKLHKTGETTLIPILDKLFSFDPVSGSAKEIAGFGGRIVFNFTLSPTGEMAAFQLQGKGLHVINADGSGLRWMNWGEKAVWIPDGVNAIVSVVEDDGHNITSGELFLVNMKTGESKPLTAHTSIIALQPSLSPEGEFVLFGNPEDGGIYKMRLP